MSGGGCCHSGGWQLTRFAELLPQSMGGVTKKLPTQNNKISILKIGNSFLGKEIDYQKCVWCVTCKILVRITNWGSKITDSTIFHDI
jgi:hypothetical protein